VIMEYDTQINFRMELIHLWIQHSSARPFNFNLRFRQSSGGVDDGKFPFLGHSLPVIEALLEAHGRWRNVIFDVIAIGENKSGDTILE
jgi:hypothetical protein